LTLKLIENLIEVLVYISISNAISYFAKKVVVRMIIIDYYKIHLFALRILAL
jgi:hypothetical protein